jgi:hypothetical protein
MGLKEVSIQGVEMQKFGKDQLGSYPIHFHMDQDLTGKNDPGRFQQHRPQLQ